MNAEFVGDIIKANYDSLVKFAREHNLPLPYFEGVARFSRTPRAEARKGQKFLVFNPAPRGGRLERLGCGYYGCVFPTTDPKIVLKISVDMSEGDFVGYYFNNLQSYHPGITKYYGIVKKSYVFRSDAIEGRTVWFIWREEFEEHGDLNIGLQLHQAKEDMGRIIDLHLSLENHSDPGNPHKAGFEKALIDADKEFYKKCMAIDKEANYYNQVSLIGAALWDMYRSHKILITDVHLDNIGFFPDRGWAITDPGQNYFLDQEALEASQTGCEELTSDK